MKREKRTSARLKSIELMGYKTFVSRNVFEFAPTITAFVGPNGSGKSNIADCIRWVLGEQSFSLLRGKKTEDMIFSGSESRPRASMASATITFDNADGWLPIDFTEVTIGRRAYRDGMNEYLINGQKMRLRDVQELLGQSGLAQRTYTIIGQGLVDAALSLNPDERRKLFEEAAGISLYRSRKEEALRRLETTRRNLERVHDILTELRPRLRSLERQATRVREYDQVREELKEALRIYYGYQWSDLQSKVRTASRRTEEAKRERDALREQQQYVEGGLLAVRKNIEQLRRQLNQWTEAVNSLYRDRERVGRTLAVSKERGRWLAEEIESSESDLEMLETRRNQIQARVSRAEEEAEAARAEVEVAQMRISKLGEKAATPFEKSKKQALDAKVLRQRLEEVAALRAKRSVQMDQLSEQLVSNTRKQNQAEVELERREGVLRDLQEAQKKQKARFDQLDRVYRETERKLKESEGRLEENREKREALLAQYARLQAKQASLKAKAEVLERVAFESKRSTEQVLERIGELGIEGFVGQLWRNLKIDDGYERPVTAALGGFRHAFAFRTLEGRRDAIHSFQKEDEIRPVIFARLLEESSAKLLDKRQDPDVLGNAFSFVEAHPAYRPLVQSLLGRVLVVRNAAAAERALIDLQSDSRVVTLDGDLYFPEGHVALAADRSPLDSIGSEEEVSEELGEVDQSIKVLRDKAVQLDNEGKDVKDLIENLRDELQNLEADRDACRAGHEQARFEAQKGEQLFLVQSEKLKELQAEVARAEQALEKMKVDEAQGKTTQFSLDQKIEEALGVVEAKQPEVALVQARSELALAERAYAQARKRLEDLSDQVGALELTVDQRREKLSKTKVEEGEKGEESAAAEINLAEVDRKIDLLQEKIEPQKEAIAEAEKQRSKLEAEESATRAGLQTAERANSQAAIELARREEELINLRRRIEDDFGLVAFEYDNGETRQDPLPIEGWVEHLPEVEQLPEGTAEQVRRLRYQIRRLGSVNPEARREYAEVRDREAFLTSQIDDLQKAEGQIQEVIAELDLLMEREFRKTFDAVAIEFRSAFTRLFGGGAAQLTLTDPNDLTQTGIDIEARLPGRREQGLAVLSGGERSLTASALIFALLKVSPTPFCVLDEVDAMLDDVNVVRFREMLQELSQDTQFVVITHNRQTVQAAEVVFGVTMRSDSSSQVISLKLDEAERAIEARAL